MIGLAVIVAAGLAHFATAYYFALYLQQIRGLTPVEAGAALVPIVGLFAVGAPASGFLNHRYGPRLPITTGLLLLAAGLLGLPLTGLDVAMSSLIAFLLLMGLGIGLTQPAVEVVIGAAPAHLPGRPPSRPPHFAPAAQRSRRPVTV